MNFFHLCACPIVALLTSSCFHLNKVNLIFWRRLNWRGFQTHPCTCRTNKVILILLIMLLCSFYKYMISNEPAIGFSLLGHNISKWMKIFWLTCSICHHLFISFWPKPPSPELSSTTHENVIIVKLRFSTFNCTSQIIVQSYDLISL